MKGDAMKRTITKIGPAHNLKEAVLECGHSEFFLPDAPIKRGILVECETCDRVREMEARYSHKWGMVGNRA